MSAYFATGIASSMCISATSLAIRLVVRVYPQNSLSSLIRHKNITSIEVILSFPKGQDFFLLFFKRIPYLVLMASVVYSSKLPKRHRSFVGSIYNPSSFAALKKKGRIINVYIVWAYFFPSGEPTLKVDFWSRFLSATSWGIPLRSISCAIC